MKKSVCLAILLAVVACAAIISTPSTTEAGGCQNYSYASSYYTPSYSYYTPSYNYYQPTYYAPTYQYQEVYKPYAVKGYISPDFYFSTQDHYQQQTQASRDQLLTDAAAFRAVQAILGLQGNAGSVGSANSLRPGKYVPAPGERQQAQQQVGTASQTAIPPGAGGGVPEGLQAVVEAKCIRCHGGDRPGRLNLSNLAAVSKVDRFDSWERTNGGEMPKGGQPLPDKEEALFRQWARGR